MPEKNKNSTGGKSIAASVYVYIIFMLMIYALFVGFRMSEMLSAKTEIGAFLKSAHYHVLLDSFLMLLLIHDYKIKRLEGIEVSRAVSILGFGVLGVILVTAGFSIAAFVPPMIAKGLAILHIGNPLLFFSFFAYFIAAIVCEVNK